MKLSRYEQETIINYNEEESSASIYTHNKALQRKLRTLVDERPKDCHIEGTCHEGQALSFVVPKSWIKVNPPRRRSDAQRATSMAALQKACSTLKSFPTRKES